MKTFILSLLLFTFVSLSASNVRQLKSSNEPDDKNCINKNLVLKSERTEKDRKFVFWKLRHKKIIVVDQIFDNNGNRIFKKTSIYICSMDACDILKFRRLKIIENEIWLFHHNQNVENCIIKRYNLCGKYLGQKKWEEDKSFTDY